MERLFNKVLPLPKQPRVYRVPPPAKPLSWVPKGTLGNDEYERRLEQFATEIRAINQQQADKYSSRGWCYILEGERKIDKDEFPSCQKAINDCRKLGLLAIDFVREDQDETRHFKGIIDVSNPHDSLLKLKADVDSQLSSLPTKITDYWKGEEYYLMMCVEKGDILNLFKPVCDEYRVPIVSSKGWAPILLRSHIANLAKKAEKQGLKPVVLLFYDHDPAGLKISDTFRKNMDDCIGGTGYDPSSLIIERFGLNSDTIEKYGLMWIDNLRTGSGREAQDPAYIQQFGRRKCECNAFLKNEETRRAAREICGDTIEKYYGKGSLQRFKEKEAKAKEKLGGVFETDMWTKFDEMITDLIDSFEEEEEGEAEEEPTAEQELDVFLEDRYTSHPYASCPKCGIQFNELRVKVGQLVRCRYCGAPLRIKAKPKGGTQHE
jgi:DNA-directed RNA polymerase subunit RPC12/RpoP